MGALLSIEISLKGKEEMEQCKLKSLIYTGKQVFWTSIATSQTPDF